MFEINLSVYDAESLDHSSRKFIPAEITPPSKPSGEMVDILAEQLAEISLLVRN